jgi:lysophospholipase L1-like esterase
MNDKMDDTNVLEEIEWISLRWHNAPDTSKPRILLVGDSIVAGHGARVYELLKDDLCVDFLATSKHITNNEFMSDLDFMLKKSNYELILFNNGLHGFDVADKYYKEALSDALTFLKTQTKCLCWRNSTPILSKDLKDFNAERNPRVISRNSDAQKVADSLNLKSLDLYTPMAEDKTLFCQDAVHYTEEGQKTQAKMVAEFIRTMV